MIFCINKSKDKISLSTFSTKRECKAERKEAGSMKLKHGFDGRCIGCFSPLSRSYFLPSRNLSFLHSGFFQHYS